MAFSTSLSEEAAADPRPQRLVDAARDLANETGSAAFTVAQVAGRAELSLKSFYRCFRGKDELLLALIEDDSGVGAAMLAQRIAARTDGIRAFVDELFDMLTLPGASGYAGILVREYQRLAEHYPDELRSALAPLTGLLAPLIATPDPRDTETVFGLLVSGIREVVLGRADAREQGTYLAQFCERALEV
jgi:AcrR family transcriptional regulator